MTIDMTSWLQISTREARRTQRLLRKESTYKIVRFQADISKISRTYDLGFFRQKFGGIFRAMGCCNEIQSQLLEKIESGSI